jgi:transcriptional regulator with XRE-family HTH domain
MDDKVMIGFSKFLKDKMRERGLTLSALSKETGISKSSLHAYTLGTQPVLKNFLKLVNFFQVPVDDFVRAQGEHSLDGSKTIRVEVYSNVFEIKIKKVK